MGKKKKHEEVPIRDQVAGTLLDELCSFPLRAALETRLRGLLGGVKVDTPDVLGGIVKFTVHSDQGPMYIKAVVSVHKTLPRPFLGTGSSKRNS